MIDNLSEKITTDDYFYTTKIGVKIMSFLLKFTDEKTLIREDVMTSIVKSEDKLLEVLSDMINNKDLQLKEIYVSSLTRLKDNEKIHQYG